MKTYEDHLEALIRKRDAEIERLRGIVDKLPKTTDGVPVVPGMRVWRYTLGKLDNWCPCHEYGVPINSYSTRESAEAACNDPSGDGGRER